VCMCVCVCVCVNARYRAVYVNTLSPLHAMCARASIRFRECFCGWGRVGESGKKEDLIVFKDIIGGRKPRNEGQEPICQSRGYLL
jgi:hypothetical protein